MSVFLKAEWKKLVMANYAVDPAVLSGFIPANTELDIWNNTCYVSLVGFMFLNTRIKGIKIPFHVNFEEVNLRFYVKHFHQKNEWRRGVVFIKEYVPKPALTFVANTIYGEHYETLPMNHSWKSSGSSQEVEYRWKGKKWNSINVTAGVAPVSIDSGSEAEFITEHYWGYTRIDFSKTSAYGVEHPRWKIYPLKGHHIDVDFGGLYGREFEFLNSREPVSVFLAEGSEILVNSGTLL